MREVRAGESIALWISHWNFATGVDVSDYSARGFNRQKDLGARFGRAGRSSPGGVGSGRGFRSIAPVRVKNVRSQSVDRLNSRERWRIYQGIRVDAPTVDRSALRALIRVQLCRNACGLLYWGSNTATAPIVPTGHPLQCVRTNVPGRDSDTIENIRVKELGTILVRRIICYGERNRIYGRWSEGRGVKWEGWSMEYFAITRKIYWINYRVFDNFFFNEIGYVGLRS